MRYPKGIERLENNRKVGTVRWLMRLGLLLAAMVLTAGCSGGGDDPDSSDPGHVTPGSGTTPDGSDSGMPILFSAKEQQGMDVTRATGLEDLDIHEFTVYGYKNESNVTQQVFPGYIVRWIKDSHSTTTTNTNDWEYVDQQPIGAAEQQTIKYWDLAAHAYRFFGYAAGDVTLSSDASAATFSFVADSDNPDAAPYFSKLWYSANVNDFGRPVQLEFMKPFVRVRIIITLADPNAALLLEDMYFKPSDGSRIVTKGDLVVKYPLTGDEDADKHESYDIENPSGLFAFTEEYTDENPRWYTVLVLAEPQGAYTFSITINKEEPKQVVVPAEYMAWKPGYQYTYTFKISEQGGITLGGVQSAYIKWKDANADHEVYNW